MSDLQHLYEKTTAERAAIQRQKAALEKRDAELAIVERELAAFLSDTGPIAFSDLAGDIVQRARPDATKRGRRKPKGIPTIFRMTCDILREAAAEGRPWLDAQEITERIKQHWWPEAEVAFVQPQIWRAAVKRKVLDKDGTLYALPNTPKEKGSAGPIAEPSLSNGSEVSAWSAASVPAGGIADIASISLATHQPRT